MGKHDDKTEKPTGKRKREARQKGQVAVSRELSSWFVALAATLMLPLLFRSAENRMVGLVASVMSVTGSPTPQGALRVLGTGLADVVILVLPVAGGFGIIGVLVSVAQTGGLFSLKAATPKFSRVNPLAGLKRLFSAQSLWQLAKQAIKIAVLVIISYKVVGQLGRSIVGSQPVDITPIITYAGSEILGLVRDVSAVGLALALVDYGIQRRRHTKSLMMTKLEVKEESRQSEGDPLVKREVRRKQWKMSRARMIAAVAGADVIVTNPTHYAVALRYKTSQGGTPQVVAKGVDEVALRIREEAAKHGIPIVEDRPLAQAIFAACEVDDFIPKELYVAVARVLAFIFTLPAVVRNSGTVHRRLTSALVA